MVIGDRIDREKENNFFTVFMLPFIKDLKIYFSYIKLGICYFLRRLKLKTHFSLDRIKWSLLSGPEI